MSISHQDIKEIQKEISFKEVTGDISIDFHNYNYYYFDEDNNKKIQKIDLILEKGPISETVVQTLSMPIEKFMQLKSKCNIKIYKCTSQFYHEYKVRISGRNFKSLYITSCLEIISDEEKVKRAKYLSWEKGNLFH